MIQRYLALFATLLFLYPFKYYADVKAEKIPEPIIPDSGRTPGHLCSYLDADFSEFRYDEYIPYCNRNVSEGLKNQIYKEYGIPAPNRQYYTIDHLIPLAIGGSNSKTNLWPEPKALKAKRPNLEYDVYLQLKYGEITQERAIEVILNAKFYPNPWHAFK